MPTYISLLRGINVSGQKMIKMEALRALYESLGFKKVETYIQSGNVIFQAKASKPQELEKKITKAILAEFGFEVPVLVKTPDELTSVLKNNPFVNKRKEDITRLYVILLSHAPDPVLLDKLKAGDYMPEEFILSGTTVYLFCPSGYGRAKLNNNFIENKLKVTATTRNWNTINELVRIAGTFNGKSK